MKDKELKITELFVDKSTEKMLEAIHKALETCDAVELHFGHKIPHDDLLEAIAPLWRRRKVFISVINDWDFKQALRTIKRYAFKDKKK